MLFNKKENPGWNASSSRGLVIMFFRLIGTVS